MSDDNDRTKFDQLIPRLHQTQFGHLRSRLDFAQLKRTITALYDSLPEAKAKDAEATPRRMFERARRWEADGAPATPAVGGAGQKPQYGGTL